MGDQMMTNEVLSSTTHIPGRALNSVRNHHFIIDGSTSPKEELTPIDVFLAGISSCAVHLMERFAEDGGVKLDRAEAFIEGVRRVEEPSRFAQVNLRLELTGPSQTEAEALVERFKGR